MTDLAARLSVFTSQGLESSAFFEAIVGDPIVDTTIDGASSITLTLDDPERVFLAQVESPADEAKAYCTLDGDLTFSLAIVRKAGDTLTLIYEDAVVAALRKYTERITLKPGSTAFAAFVQRLADEASVQVDLDTSDPFPATTQLGRSLGDTATSSWQVYGGLARSQGWRCFSDGSQVVIGPDSWLLGRGTPLVVNELVYPVQEINFAVAPNMTTHSCIMHVATPDFVCVPGQVIDIDDEGPHGGLWIVAKWRRGVSQTSPSAVHLIRSGSAANTVLSFDDRSGHLPTPISTTAQVGEVVAIDGSDVYATVLGGDKNHPLGPCRGLRAGVHVGAMVLLVQTPQGPWITAVDS